MAQVSFRSSLTDRASFLPQHLPCNKGFSHYPGQRNGGSGKGGPDSREQYLYKAVPLSVSTTMCGDPEFKMSQVPSLSLAIVLIPSRIP